MRSELHHRPGLARGPYPERDERIPGRLEQVWQRLAGRLRQTLPAGSGGLKRISARIEAEGQALRGMDEAGLAERVLELRRRLRAEGLDGEAAIASFALVREQARRVLGIEPYPEQLMGGWALLQGRVAEMQTGEGKTLTATLPATTAALAGVPALIVTVNDYLVERDAESMGPVYRALGLGVGVVTEDLDLAARQAAYGRDICYCTNKQLAFDYLRDRLVRKQRGDGLRLRLAPLLGDRSVRGGLRLRGLCFAILDEADSVLVDEARTPLIISAPGDAAEAAAHYRQALDLAAALEPGRHWQQRRGERDIELLDAGRERLAELAAGLGGAWTARRRREDLVRQALIARELFHRDTHYLMQDERVQIIDEYTGRLMPDRSWERGLHQLIEAKEGCPVTAETAPLARISYQRFFRRWLHLAGMTGTAREVTAELWATYGLAVVSIPTHRPMRRRRLPTRCYADAAAKWRAVAGRVRELSGAGRPVLIGTRSVAASETLSAHLTAAGIRHRLLNARQDGDEAAIVAEAGQPGCVTVATNMAGRGTDIVLGPGVAELGGLHVIGTEYHEARRIDRQLFGRGARQGDPGSAEQFAALDDELVLAHWPRWLLRAVAGAAGRDGRVPTPLSLPLLRRAQRAAEVRHAGVRRRLLQLDERLSDLLAFSGRPE